MNVYPRMSTLPRRWAVSCLAATCILLPTISAHASDASESGIMNMAEMPDLLDLSIEELMDISVVSASRSEQTLGEIAVPISVLTAQEIHDSGASNLPELLQLIPSVDVRRIDRTRYMVGVRGLFGNYSDRTLVLLNGRDTLNPALAAPDWLNLPVLLEDIERIEVVRGAGGAVWGANAFTGVINIITKAPDQTKSMVQSSLSHFGDTSSHIRYLVNEERWAWRTSVGYESLKNSDRAGAGELVSSQPALNPLIGFGLYQVRDFGRYLRVDSQADVEIAERTQASFGAAHSSSESGDREFVGYFPQKDLDVQHTRLFANWERSHTDTSRTNLQWYSNFYMAGMPHIVDQLDYYQHDLAIDHQFQAGEGHNLSMGGNVRTLKLKGQNLVLLGEAMFPSETDEYLTGIYLVDRYQCSARWALEAQGRLDYYSVTNLDWSARLAALRDLDAEKKHRARFAVARAFRVPNVGARESTLTALGGLNNIVAPPFDVENETTIAVEAGYTGQLDSNLNVRADVFYQHLDDIVGVDSVTVGPATNFFFTNIGSGSSYGVELECQYRWRAGHASLWYTYHDQDENLFDKGSSTRAFLPAPHKAGLRAHVRLCDSWYAICNYTYNDEVPTPGRLDFDRIHRLDLGVTKRFAASNSEITLGVRDLLNDDLDPIFDVPELTSFTTPGRTFFVRGQIQTK